MIVTESIEQELLGMATTRLVKIVLAALGTMGETEQINFIAKHIDARASLSHLGEDNPEAFLDKVEKFCLACLNGDFYSDENDIEEYFSDNDYDDAYYDDDWNYAEYYSNTEWAVTFTKLFRLSAMYIQSGDVSTGYEATSRLLSCLTVTTGDYRFFGTDEPDDYIVVNWYELFSLYYDAMFQYLTDTEQAIEKAFHYWMDFGERCTEGFLSNVKDIRVAEVYILDGLKTADDWAIQYQCFYLLEQLYSRLGEDFDKASKAKSLLDVNDYFHRVIVEGLCEQGDWQAAVESANHALTKIPIPSSDTADWHQKNIQQKVRESIQTKLADAYQNLADYELAFMTLSQMFQEAPNYELYVRARALAARTVGVTAFLESVEAQLEENPRVTNYYVLHDLILNIFSYEGATEKLLNIAQSKKIGANYYGRKYIALSLIYRAVDGVEGVGESLSAYLASASGQDGIIDMPSRSGDEKERSALLLAGADLLKGIVSFHIDAAKRPRYAKAAYYMCVIRDIFAFLKREDEFRDYFKDIIAQNSRRPALHDEMNVVYGKEATKK
jgi:hypothetical protein